MEYKTLEFHKRFNRIYAQGPIKPRMGSGPDVHSVAPPIVGENIFSYIFYYFYKEKFSFHRYFRPKLIKFCPAPGPRPGWPMRQSGPVYDKTFRCSYSNWRTTYQVLISYFNLHLFESVFKPDVLILFWKQFEQIFEPNLLQNWEDFVKMLHKSFVQINSFYYFENDKFLIVLILFCQLFIHKYI